MASRHDKQLAHYASNILTSYYSNLLLLVYLITHSLTHLNPYLLT